VYGHTCSDFKDCQPAVKVVKSGYIMGFYGNSSEDAIMKEIISRGPVVSDLEVPLSFSYYKKGIFSDDHSAVLKGLPAPTA